jgi:hypothetical protein
VPTDPAQACIHGPSEYTVPIKAGGQAGLIFFADGRQQMVIRPSYTVEMPRDAKGNVKDDATTKLTSLAWLIPVPNLPDTYKEADARMFGKLAEFTKLEELDKRNWGKDEKSAGGAALGREDENGMELDEVVKVGDYTIQPIRAKGELGGTELNGWLKDNGFGSVAEETLKFYVGKEYYWLAVRLHNPKGLPADGQVKPLQIGFATDKPVYPLKINAGRGSFDLDLWLITNREVDLEKSQAFGIQTYEQVDAETRQKNRDTRFSALPETARKVAADDNGLKALKSGKLYCYRFQGYGLDGSTNLAKLENDLHFEFKAAEKKAEPKGKDR